MTREASLIDRTTGGAVAVRRVLSSRPLFVALGAAAVAVAIAHRAWADTLLWIRYDPDSGQILLAPVVFIWLLYARRPADVRAMFSGWLLGPQLLAMGWAAWSFGFYRCRMTFWHCGAVFMMAGAALTFLDARAMARFGPAFLILVFMVPDPGIARYHLADPLHRVATHITQWVCDAVGINVGRHGGTVGIIRRDIAFAEACNGARRIWPLFLTVYLFAFVTPMRSWLRAGVLVVSPLIVVVASAVRLVPTVWVFGHVDPHRAFVFREASGWVILLVTFVSLVGIARLLRPAVAPSGPLPSRAPDAVDPRFPLRRILIGATATTLILGVATVQAWTAPSASRGNGYFRLVDETAAQLPREIGPWVGRDVPQDDGMALYIKLWMQPNVLINREYTDRVTGRKAGVVLVQVRDAGRLTSHDPTICYPAIGWKLLSSVHHDWTVSGMTLTGTEYRFETGSFYAFRFTAVADMVLLPDGQVGRDMELVRDRANLLAERFFGATHLQVLCDATLPQEERERIVTELLDAYGPLIRTMGAGITPRSRQAQEH